MNAKRLSILFALVFSLFLCKSAFALTLTPARFEVTTDPGTDVGGTVTLLNDQQSPVTFYSSYENFVAGDDNSGTPKFIGTDGGLATWIESPSTLTLAPGEIRKVDFTIHVPQSANPGGYFGAIFWNTTPPSGSQVSIGAKVGMLVLLRVSGDIKESAGISTFTRAGHGFFYTSLPVHFSYTFHNDGADRVQPTGKLIVHDTLFIPATHLDANEAKGNVLPNSSRNFSLMWQKGSDDARPGFFQAIAREWHNFAIGFYSAHLHLAYGTKGMTTESTVHFFVFPWQLLIVVIVILFIIWKGGKRLIKGYNRRIIARARATTPSA